MSVKEELNQLEKELLAKNPQDVLQFCANYFNQKLESQRKTLWAQQPMAKAAGIELFPKVEDIKTSRQPSFKSPFGENDPHLNHNEVLDSLFKGGFAVSNRTAPKLSREVDPNELSSQPQPLLQSQSKQIPVAFNANRRTSVSAEAMNPDKFKTDSWKPPKNDLTPKQRDELGNSLSSNFLFRQLEDDSRTTVLEALTKKTFKKDDQIIRQGDEGDYFYIIESGTVDFYVNGAKVNSSGEGSSFGELALMYNSPRAATAIASSDQVTCWALDRLTFRRILLEGTFNRRLMYEDFLKDVEILSGLSNQERSKLADALSTEIYHKGDIIVKEGEEGENFYFIERGNCKVYKEGTGVLTHLQKGDYFGEVALLKDLPRQATVEALDTVVVATLDKSGFTRLLGPAVDVLKSKDPTK